ncbi:ABC transporter ATP-binding protein [Infirmifilum lucidum]|uniref:ABC transporter ATP-binding protein n=1 Tax=Infirmifilum lucidum TaxID=2776706 RepID=A0A7L9FH18_9CREN|nr:ABC transporter ATP-binding protein [Infirmifilum lucidum]QOJ79100.1 ABC transporter ATP-binding protein [Infirmifilum lucidum]
MLVVENLTKDFLSYTYKKFSVPMNYIPLLYFYYKIAERTGGIERKVVRVLDNITFRVKQGEVLAILGPNGSGKTTLLRILAGLSEPTSGAISWNGEDLTWLPERRQRLCMYIPGLLGARIFTDSSLTVRNNLRRFAEFCGASGSKVDEVLALTGLDEVKDSFIYELSTGYLARITIAIGLIRDAEVYLLDETFLGLSLETKNALMDYVRDSLASRMEKAVILATNDIRDAERIADRFLFLYNGRVVEEGDVRSLLGKFKLGDRIKISVRCELSSELVRSLESYGKVSYRVEYGTVELTVLVEDAERAIPVILGEVVSRGCVPSSLSVDRPTLEDVYMHLYADKWKKPQASEVTGCYVVM